MRIVLVDDQADFRTALRDLLDTAEGIDIVGEASNGRDAIDTVLRNNPDVTLMDVRMPVMDGIAATAAIRASRPGACIIVLTTFDDDALIRDAIEAGAAGYLLKGMALDDMLSVLRLAMMGYATVAPRTRAPGQALREETALSTDVAERAARLSEREMEIWSLLGRGCTNRDIASSLFITEGTVKNYVSSILATLGVRHRTEAALLWTINAAQAPKRS